MPVNTRYYYDFTIVSTGQKARIVVTPRGKDMIPVDPRPAWGELPTGDYERILDGVFGMIEIPEHGYDVLPVGWPDAATMKLSVNVWALDTVDLEPLQESLLDPEYVYPDAGDGLPAYTNTADPDAAFEVPYLPVVGDTYRELPTGNHFSIVAQGTLPGSAVDVEDWPVVFRGVQRRTPATSFSASGIQIELVSDLKATLEMLLPSDLEINREIAGADSGPYDFLWDVGPWKNVAGTIRYGRCIAAFDRSGDHARFHMHRLSNLFDLIEAKAQLIFRALTRDEDAVFSFVATNNLGPYGGLEAHEQEGTAANTADATDLTDGFYPGFLIMSGSSAVVGGFLHRRSGDDQKGTMHAFPNIYEMLKSMTSGTSQIAQPDHAIGHQWEVTFSGILGTEAAVIVPADFIGPWSLTTGDRAITGATADAPSPTGADKTPHEHSLPGIREDNPRTVPVVFHNLPTVGEFGDRWSGIIVGASSASIHTIGTSPVTGRSWETCLFYIGNPDGILGSDHPIRIHHNIGLDSGDGVFNPSTNGIALPVPAEVTAGTPYSTWADNDLWTPLRTAMLKMQTEGCLPRTAVRLVLNLFGRPDQTVYPATVKAELAPTRELGRRCGSGFATAEDLTGKAETAAIPGRPLLVSTSFSEESGQATVKLLAIGTEVA